MQLVDLLEVPQLVDACARNGFHDESLELANFVNGLERRHLLAAEVRPANGGGKNRMGSDVIQSIVDDVHATLLGLRQQLLLLLSQQSSLPKELQILATLRKLDVLLIDRQLALERHDNAALAQLSDKQRDQLRLHFLQCAETRLQMEFLEARTVWLERLHEKVHQGLPIGAVTDLLDKAAEADGNSAEGGSSSGKAASGGKPLPTRGSAGNVLGPYGKAIEMLEANRTSWFAVVTQFNALFEDSLAESKDGGGPHPASTILNAWITRHAQQLLVDLEKLVVGIDEGAAVRSVLEQALFFAARMGQVGCDFSGSIVPIFRRIVVSRVTADWKVASVNFKSMLATERFVIDVDDVAREQIVPLFLLQDQAAAVGSDDKSASPAVSKRASDDVPAPAAVMTYPPVAYLMNAILCGLNFLRECPIASAKEEVLGELGGLLMGLMSFFVSQAAEVRSKGTKYLSKVAAEDSLDKQYTRALLRDFLPHVLSCFDHIYLPGKGSKRGKAVALHIDSLADAADHLSPDCMDLLEKCWKVLDS